MPYASRPGGVKIWFEDTGGSGPPVIFSHGFGSGSLIWRHQVEATKAAGYRVLTWDMRGHAKSDSPAELNNATYSKMTQVGRGLFCWVGSQAALA